MGGPAPARSLDEALTTCLKKYATFKGRASRSEFWFWYLGTLLAGFLGGFIDGLFDINVFLPAVVIGSLVPSIAVAVRRLHDLGASGWWYLATLLPLVGSIVFIAIGAKPAQQQANQYG